MNAFYFSRKMAGVSSFLIVAWAVSCTLGVYIPPGPRYRCPNDSLLFHPCSCVKESDVGIYVRCENSNIASISVGLNNLATFGLPIEELTLYKCHIGKCLGCWQNCCLHNLCSSTANVCVTFSSEMLILIAYVSFL